MLLLICISSLDILIPHFCILPSLAALLLDQHCLPYSTFLVGSWSKITRRFLWSGSGTTSQSHAAGSDLIWPQVESRAISQLWGQGITPYEDCQHAIWASQNTYNSESFLPPPFLSPHEYFKAWLSMIFTDPSGSKSLPSVHVFKESHPWEPCALGPF